MFTTKFWFTLVTLALGAALATLLVARTSYNVARSEDIHRVLLKDRDQAWALLKSEARVRIDEALRVAADPTVVKVLSKATVKADSVTSDDRAELASALRRQNKNLESLAGDLLVAVNAEGEAVASEWPEGPDKIGRGLAGFPAVEHALRGYMTDDVWALSTDGDNTESFKVYRVATRPVIGGGRYVGAVVHGQTLSTEFATTLARRLQAQVVFFRGSVILASGQPNIEGYEPISDQVIAGPIEQLLQDEGFLRTGRSSVVELPGGGLAVYALVMGQAAHIEGAGVGYAVVRTVPTMASSLEFMTGASLQDWQEAAQSTEGMILIGSVFLVLILGFVAFSLEHGSPLRKLRKSVNRLAAREVDRLNIYGVSRKHRKMAEAINTAMDKAVQDVAEKLGKKPADIDQILGPRDTDDRVSSALFTFPDGASEDVPPPPPVESGAPPQPGPPAGPPGASPAMQPPAGAPPAQQAPPPAASPAQPAPPPPASPAQPAPAALGAPPPAEQPAAGPKGATLFGQPAPMIPPGAGAPAPPAQSPAPPPATGDIAAPQPPGGGGFVPRGPGAPDAAPPPGAAAVAPPAASPGAPFAEGTPPTVMAPGFQPPPEASRPEGGGTEEDEDKTEIAGVPEELLRAAQMDEVPAEEVDEETYFHQIFEEFVAAKNRCGERTDNLQFERFRQTLDRNKAALVERYGCKSVKFQVYVKDGKAALKATPVRG